MTTAGIQKIILEETKQRPLEMQSEILDFILYLKSKNTSKSKLDKLPLSLLQTDEIIHLEKEFADYKNLYPHE